MKIHYLLLSVLFFIFGCADDKEVTSEPASKSSSAIVLDITEANRLAALPFKCMQVEFPNKTGQVLNEATDLGTPKQLHPAFYGCFDWHSSVHGHWSLVKMLKDFPDLEKRDSIILRLRENLTADNISREIAYFNRKQEYSYERMYGWTWLLKLQQDLDGWQDGVDMASNLRPLTQLIVERYKEFLPKLNYPIRVGTHTNSAFGMSFAHDYAVHANDTSLRSVLEETARRLYLSDKGCPLTWEPDGFDFLSPCLEEVTLMQRVLPEDRFLPWLDDFLPQLKNADFKMEVAKVSDRTDGHLVHLDGLNFSRAWVFYRLAAQFPKQYGHLKSEGDKHLNYSLPSIVDGSYEGEHWLASFALNALAERERAEN